MEQDRKPSASIVQNSASIQAGGSDTAKATAEEPSSTSLVANQIDSNTPPAREEGFAMFKCEQGSALNKIFLENKGKQNENKKNSFLFSRLFFHHFTFYGTDMKLLVHTESNIIISVSRTIPFSELRTPVATKMA